MMLASTALTAFGQVITTMVAATVVLRDRADRVHELLASSPLTPRQYRLGKLLAALVMLCLIYTAIPLGLIAGAVVRGGDLIASVTGALRPFVLLVLPTMLAVGLLQFAAGVLSGRLWVIVGLGLVLIWMWSAAVAAVSSPDWSGVAVLADPFGSTPLLRATAAWTDQQRAAWPMPVTAGLLVNRGCWLALALALAWLAVVRTPTVRRQMASVMPSALQESVDRTQQITTSLVLVRGGAVGFWRGTVAVAAYVVRWMLRDPGWRVLSVLGAMNVGVHAVLDAPRSATTEIATAHALLMLGTHARLFLVLLATIYAGELVWREREERSAALFDVMPIGTAAMVGGRIVGALLAQVAVVVLLSVTALVGTLLVTRAAVDPIRFAQSAVWLVAVPFAGWMLVSVSVQVLVQQKLAAHLLVIAAWTVAVLGTGGAAASSDVLIPHAGWAIVAVLAMVVSGLGWVRGGDRVWRVLGR